MKSAFKFSQSYTKQGLDRTDVQYLRQIRREFGPKTAWTTLYFVHAYTWCAENEILKFTGSLAGIAVTLYVLHLMGRF